MRHLLLLMLAVGCAPAAPRDSTPASTDPTTLGGPTHSSADAESILVQRMYHGTSQDRALQDSLLGVAYGLVSTAGEPLRGLLYRFTTDSPPSRYLLVRLVSSTTSDAGGIQLVALARHQDVATATSELIPEATAEGFAVSRIEDFDGDQQVDVAYCVWRTADDPVGLPSAAGFREGRGWYRIVRAVTPLPHCRT